MSKRWLVAGLIGAVLSAVAGVPARADTAGLSGTVVDTTGAPVAACLTLVDTGGAEIAGPCTGADGTYTVASSIQGTFLIRAHADGFVDLWGSQQLSRDTAQFIGVNPASPTVLNFTMFHAAATVTGRITKASGEPVNGADVRAVPPGGFFFDGYHADTDANGRYRLTVPPGRYQIGYSDILIGTMWAPGTEQQSDAQIYPLGDGATATVDGAFLPLGAVQVIIRDELSGALVQRGCAFINNGLDDERCTTNGVVRIADVPPGSWTVTVRPEGTHWPTSVDVPVRRAETTTVTVRVRRAAAAVTAMQDARTHRPVAGVCVRTVLPSAGIAFGSGVRYCSGNDGRLVVGPLDPATFDLFAFAPDDSYGAQWVGSLGGTGDRRLARTVTTATAAPVILPPIQLDRAGTIAGVVQDKATGAPIGGVCAYPYAFDPGNGGDFGTPNCTDATGHYQITGLGPYAWPVEFVTTDTYAWQWSGGATNRYDATPVTVRVGRTATANAKLVQGARISGVVTNTAGTPASALVIVRNARTGDNVASTNTQPNSPNRYGVQGLAAQNVKVEYFVGGTACYFDRKPTLATATVVAVTGDRTVNLAGCG